LVKGVRSYGRGQAVKGHAIKGARVRGPRLPFYASIARASGHKKKKRHKRKRR
jgi:hypothetical protein